MIVGVDQTGKQEMPGEIQFAPVIKSEVERKDATAAL